LISMATTPNRSRCHIRTPYPPPTHADGGLGGGGGATASSSGGISRIQFRHPGYPDTGDTNIMLILPALDSSSNEGSGRFGLHHETARLACAIVANCAWDGFLSTEKRRGASPISAAPDELLKAARYYFHVHIRAGEDSDDSDSSGDNGMLRSPTLQCQDVTILRSKGLTKAHTDILAWRYPVVPSFAHFRFPHDNLPPSWTSASLAFPEPPPSLQRWTGFADMVVARDETCRITNHSLGTETAHLVPRSEEAWYRSNGMTLYNSRPEAGTDDARNALLLRSDLHTLFDARKFVVVPKDNTWIVHVLVGRPSEELGALYHNVKLLPLVDLSVECLFARFAWAVLAQGLLVRNGVERRLVVLEKEETVVRNVSGKQCRLTFEPQLPGGKSRSVSPKKRQREEGNAANDDVGDDDDDDSLDDGSIWSQRGRKKKRGDLTSSPSSFGCWRDDISDVTKLTYDPVPN
jgi:hypothetical protein